MSMSFLSRKYSKSSAYGKENICNHLVLCRGIVHFCTNDGL